MPVPKGWEIKKFGDVIDIQGGSQPPKSEFIYEPKENYIQLLQIRDFGENGVPTFVPKNRVTKFCDEDDVLIARYGASLGRIVTGLAGAYNVALAKTIFDESVLLKRFVYYLLQTQIFQVPLTMISRSAQNGFAKHEIAHIEIPIPPLATQQAIVNKIETLFADIDAGIGCLKTAEQQLKQYRQALLKNAFNGELTKQWRTEHAESLPSAAELLEQIQTAREQHYAQQLADWQSAVKNWEENGKQGKKPSKPKANPTAVQFEEDFADLPNGWGLIKINQIADIFTGATPLKSNSAYYDNGSIPWVTSGSLNNEFVSTPDNFVTDLALKETNLKLLPKHTLLVAMYGEGKTRGKCSELLIEATTNQAIAGIVINEKLPINRKFLKFYMFKNYADIRRQSSGGVQPNLNLSLIGNIIFPFPCLAEQTQIVAILESKLTACDHLATELATQLKQAELLKQAVLKAAFSGKLLEQSE
ncbi:restriction endonuclease subunit S [Gallibacterium anatis]|uniref:restriction endonuclease subunit S n=2 Tax=Gallibacterium anatis TaxID=750 RepID=UPI002551B545|nr:restriction endonuclease subunit S [Gallibacterium anatis]WIM81932.1 restriction endonuclease subunit S [Gallibacterium anatis]